MFWYKLGAYFGMLINWSVFGYILYDGYTKISNGESAILSFIALMVYAAYMFFGKALTQISNAVDYIAQVTLVNESAKKQVNDFEQLLNNYKYDKWDFGKDS